MNSLPQNPTASVKKRNPHLFPANEAAQDASEAEKGAKVASDRESKLHDQIIEQLVRRRFYFVRSRMDKKTTQPKGTPDFICAAPNGIVYFIEVKKPGAKLTKEQTITRHVLLALGHRHHVVYHMDDFLRIVDAAREALKA